VKDHTRKWWLIGVVLGLLGWWWLWRWWEQLAKRPQLYDETSEEKPSTPSDDLKRIEGIGPKIAAILQETGIASFEALASTTVERLQTILDDSGIRLAWPETWPEQARLAAAGDWAALEALQDELQAGRRV
jgi:hypothetical protein